MQAHLWHQCGCLAQGHPHIPDGEQCPQEASCIMSGLGSCRKVRLLNRYLEMLWRAYGCSPQIPPCSSSFPPSSCFTSFLGSPLKEVFTKLQPEGVAGASQGSSGSHRGQGFVAPRSWILVVPSRDAIKTHLRVAKEVGYNKREQLLPPGLLF